MTLLSSSILIAPYSNLLLALYDYPSMIAPEGGWEDFYSGDPADAIGTGPFMMAVIHAR